MDNDRIQTTKIAHARKEIAHAEKKIAHAEKKIAHAKTAHDGRKNIAHDGRKIALRTDGKSLDEMHKKEQKIIRMCKKVVEKCQNFPKKMRGKPRERGWCRNWYAKVV